MYTKKGSSPVAVLVALSVIIGLTIAQEHERSDFKRSLTKNCENSYSLTCMKLDLVSWVEKMNEEEQYSVIPGVTVVRENSSARANTADLVSELAREFPNDPEARLDAFLLKKVTGYLNGHSIRVSLFDKNSVVSARKKDKYGLGLALAAGAMMKGMMFALALGGLALLSGKALMTGLISMLLSSVIGLKSLTSGGHKSTTYEIVAKPVYSHGSTHSHEEAHHAAGSAHGAYSYGRSFETPLPLSLQPGYTP